MNHSKFSPSSRHRWANCPASVNVDCPPIESDAALSGTRQHWLLSLCITGKVHPASLVGYEFSDLKGKYTVKSEWCENIAVAYDYVMSKINDGYSVICEYRTADFHGSFGTIDIVLKKDKMVYLVDYKSGFKSVATEINHQVEHYAVLFDNEWPGYEIKGVIVQPMNFINHVPVIKEYSFDIPSLREKIINEINAPKDQFNPGPLQCHRCPQMESCPAFLSFASSTVGMSLIENEKIHLDESKLTDIELGAVLDNASLIKAFIDACEKEATHRIRSGRTIPGYKIVKSSGRRKWKLPEDEIKAKLTKLGIPKDSTVDVSVISPARLDKLKWTKKDGSTQGLSKNQLEMVNTNYVERSDAESLVNEYDSRPGLVFNLESMFTPILPKWMKK